jgi:hypothetical protein
MRRTSSVVTDSSNRQFTPAFTALILVKRIHIESPGRSTPSADFAFGYLLHSVPGLEAEFKDGKPVTTVVAMYRPPKRRQPVATPGKVTMAPPDLAMIAHGSQNIKKFDEWQVLIFENARMTPVRPAGVTCPVLCGNYLSIGPKAWERGKKPWPRSNEIRQTKAYFVLPTMVMPRVVGGARAYQKVAIADPSAAKPIRSEAELRSAIEERMNETSAGYPGFVLVSRQILQPGKYSEDQEFSFASDPNTRTASISLLTPVPLDERGNRLEQDSGRTAASYARRSTDEAVAAIRPEHRARALWQPGWQHSFIPVMGFPQSMFAYGKSHDAAQHYRFDEQGYGFADSIVLVAASENGSGGWVSTFQKPVNSCGDIVSPEDMVTPDMPAYHRRAADLLVKENTAARLKFATEQANLKMQANRERSGQLDDRGVAGAPQGYQQHVGAPGNGGGGQRGSYSNDAQRTFQGGSRPSAPANYPPADWDAYDRSQAAQHARGGGPGDRAAAGQRVGQQQPNRAPTNRQNEPDGMPEYLYAPPPPDDYFEGPY